MGDSLARGGGALLVTLRQPGQQTSAYRQLHSIHQHHSAFRYSSSFSQLEPSVARHSFLHYIKYKRRQSSNMASSATVAQRLEEAKALSSKDPFKAENIYKDILSQGVGTTESASRDYEAALIGLGELYRDGRRPQELAELIKTSWGVFSSFAKAKTAKLGKWWSDGRRI